MNSRLLVVAGLLLLVLGALRAQPTPDDTWLRVRVLQDDGTPLPGMPRILLARCDDQERKPVGRLIFSQAEGVSLIGLSPGAHEMQVVLPPYMLVDGPKTLDILPGPNEIVWRLPPLIPLGGEVTLAGEKAPVPNRVMTYLWRTDRPIPQPIFLSLTRGAYQISGLFPGAYRMLLLTDQGFELATLTVPTQAGNVVTQPLALHPGGVVDMVVTDDAAAPLPNTQVALIGEVEHGVTLTIPLTTDRKGAVSSLHLPPGRWMWKLSAERFQPASGDITLAAGATCPLKISLVKR